MIDRLPPQSLEAEQSVLGAILIDRDAVIEVAEFLRPADFYRQANGRDLRGRPRAVRAPRADRHRHRRGGARAAATSSRRSAAAPTCRACRTRRRPRSTPSQYARIVERKAVLRNLIGAAGRIAGHRLRGSGRGPGGDRPGRGGALRGQPEARRRRASARSSRSSTTPTTGSTTCTPTAARSAASGPASRTSTR